MEAPMQKPNDLNQSRIVLKQDSTLIAVIQMSLSSWLVAGVVPGVEGSGRNGCRVGIVGVGSTGID
jgi:hypothetical protein